MKVILLGGCGAQGITATRSLVEGSVFSEVVIADIDLEKAQKAVKELNNPKVSAISVDVSDHNALVSSIKGADVVVNCTGPYYILGPKVVEAAIEAGINYIDYCDDIVAHEKIFTYGEQAKQKGITVLVGLGFSPGIAPLVVMHAAGLMDQVDDIFLPQCINDAEPEGPAVVYHLLENFSGMVPIIKNGHLVYEQAFEGEEVVDFGGAMGMTKVSTFGHPELFTLPRVIKGIKNMSIKLGTYPPENYDVLKMLSQIGLAGKDPIKCKGQDVVPRDFLVSYLLYMKEVFGTDPNAYDKTCALIEVKGKKDGKAIIFKYSMTGHMGPATGLPTAIGAEMLAKKEITVKGVVSPEECIVPKPFIDEALRRIRKVTPDIIVTETIITTGDWD
jgi:saccharopine dehydrogenase (NAD+, L-lysine-forming)